MRYIKTVIGRWLINWYADLDTPDWLRAEIHRDPSWQAYRDQLNRVGRRLNHDAESWCHEPSPHADWITRDPRPRHRRISTMQTKAALGLAGLLAAIAATLLVTGEIGQRTEPAPKRGLARASDGDVDPQMIEAVRSLAAVYDATRQAMAATADRWAQVSDTEALLRSVDGIALGRTTLRSMDGASRTYGQSLSILQQNVRAQRDQLLSKMRDGWNAPSLDGPNAGHDLNHD